MKKGTLISQNSFFFSVGERIRTPDLLVRSQTLYPAELRPHLSHSQVLFPDCLIIIAHITGECKRFFKFRIFCLFIKTFILLSATPSNLPWSGCCHSDAHHSGAAPPVPSFSPAASPHMFFELSLFHYPGTHFNIISGVIYRVFQFLYFMLRHRNPPL